MAFFGIAASLPRIVLVLPREGFPAGCGWDGQDRAAVLVGALSVLSPGWGWAVGAGGGPGAPNAVGVVCRRLGLDGRVRARRLQAARALRGHGRRLQRLGLGRPWERRPRGQGLGQVHRLPALLLVRATRSFAFVIIFEPKNV